MLRKLAIWGLLFVFPPAFAQLGPAAQETLRAGKTAAATALSSYDVQTPDGELWQQAIAHGEEAARLAPEQPEPQRFLAQVYTTLAWYAPAWTAWQRFEELGATLDPETSTAYAQVAAALGYAAHGAGQLDAAAEYFSKALRLMPDPETSYWLALTLFDLRRPEAALPYWRDLVAAQPDNEVYAAYLARSEQQLAYGVTASDAFYQGLDALELGQRTAALNAFREALGANPDFPEALEQAGETSLRLEQPEAAVDYLERLLTLEPGNARAADQLDRAQAQLRWGIFTANRYRDGLFFYAQNRLGDARDAFKDATATNPEYEDAWAWLGRLEAEQGNLEAARLAYNNALYLAPDNKDYAETITALQDSLVAQTPPLPIPQAEVTAAVTPASTIPQPGVSATTTPALTIPQPAFTTDVQAEVVAAPAALPSTALILFDREHIHRGGYAATATTLFDPDSTLRFDLTKPADYANGTVYQRLEVLSKAGDLPLQYQLCLVPSGTSTASPSCSRASDLSFEGPGVFTASQPLSSLSNYDTIDWSKGVATLLIVLRDDEGNPAKSVYSSAEGEEVYPIAVHYNAFILPAGQAVEGWP